MIDGVTDSPFIIAIVSMAAATECWTIWHRCGVEIGTLAPNMSQKLCKIVLP